ncbi:MAG: tRNA uridine-5-carboxymethylaminomethyl(34) synthesis enzyme MnmG, partial [Gemmatimonadales bacterium]
EGGRDGEGASVELARGLQETGLAMGRFKTGTPPRIDGRSVDYDRLEIQPGDDIDYRFSAYTREPRLEQRPCWMLWTGPALRAVVEDNLEESALYGGEISGRGPRYCPSIEDKVVRFPDAERHKVFLEPEGLETTELYVNGLSTSLPADVQLAFLRTLTGLERVRMTKVGYAIEYDYFPPEQLRATLEVRRFEGLYFAGQINGTTGYEEAAGQGLMAGANAGLRARGREPLVLGRDEAYLGVMIDDLVTRGVDEPYRLFTSRAEFRLLLRHDNAVERLGERGVEVGLLDGGQEEGLRSREEERARLERWLEETRIGVPDANEVLDEVGESRVSEPQPVRELLRRPRVPLDALLRSCGGTGKAIGAEIRSSVEVEVKYEGYVARERERAERLRRQAGFVLPEDLPYRELKTLSIEGREKLERVRPESLAQAGRIPGVSASDLQNLVMEVKRWRSAVG